VSYFSKRLSKPQQNYSTSERELLAIVLAVEHFKQFLYGKRFKIITDHQPLRTLLTSDNMSARLARWLSRLQLFDFEIEYRPGKNHGNADGLSRLALEPSTEADEEDDDSAPVRINAVTTLAASINIQADQVQQEQLQDLNIKFIYDLKLQSAKENGRHVVVTSFDNKEQRSYYNQWNKIVLFNKNVYREYVDDVDNIRLQYIVPKQCRDTILEKAHKCPTSGHLGKDKTWEKLRSRCYWPGQCKDVEEFVQNCPDCQLIKPPNHYNVAELIPLRPSRPFELTTTDIMGPLPTTPEGYKYMLAVCDHFTKWIELFPLKTLTAKELAEKFMVFICRHGVPNIILSDQGTNYQAELMSELLELLDIHRTKTTPYHPQCDGLTERYNRTIKSMLTVYVNENGTNWDSMLHYIQFALNTSVQKTTKCTPFELVYGRIPKVPLDLLIEGVELDLELDPEQYAINVKTLLNNAFETVRSNRDFKVDQQKFYYDRKSRAANYNIGDLVLLKDVTVKPGTAAKFKKNWKGPYKVIEKVTDLDYKIKQVNKRGKSLIVHVNRLKTFYSYKPIQLEHPVKNERNVETVHDDQIVIPVADDNQVDIVQEPRPLTAPSSKKVRKKTKTTNPVLVQEQLLSPQGIEPEQHNDNTPVRRGVRIRKQPDRLGF
jgi:hypothetical protein